jgi:polysaccharide export outer membrane protein
MTIRAVAVLASLCIFAGQAAAQVRGWDATGLHATRAELQELLARYEAAASSSGGGGAQVRMEAATIRQRLEEGDLRVGDRVLLLVEGHTQLSDTFNVVAGRKLVLPDIGDVPLAGVLRSELQEHLTAQLGRFVRNPTVRVRSLIRLEVLGLVAAPGFYAIPSDVLVTDALMLAGGPAPDADIDRVRLQRGREVLWEGDRLRAAVIEGRTLDQLGVRAGDGIFVPEKRPRFAGFRDVLVVVSGVASLVYVANRIGWL